MRNRAKCKLCNSIIESFHRYDHVICKCGEIAIEGGNEIYKCFANDFANILRVDDEGNEIIVTVVGDKQTLPSKEPVKSQEKNITSKPKKKDLIVMLEEMTKSYERLPVNAMHSPVTNADLYSSLLLLLSLFRAED